ncbi:hypothetical protein [Caenispirillum bisanense]|uniref:hypothetical protein n=1 Tax=Caenispirillum bisanense TaxID=414052 RepID=UPI0031E1BB85
MAENDDRNQVVYEPNAEGTGDGGQSAAEGLHIHGQGHEALEDGVEHVGERGGLGGTEDIFANANVQTGRRSTNEGLLAGLPGEGETLDDQSPVIVDPYTPSETDNTVESEFDAVPVGRAREATARDEDDEDEEDEEAQRTVEPDVGSLPPGQAPAAAQN